MMSLCLAYVRFFAVKKHVECAVAHKAGEQWTAIRRRSRWLLAAAR